jgi:hypothetical protein
MARTSWLNSRSEVENADREAHAGHAVDQHVERLRLARAGVAGDKDAEIQELRLGLEGRPVNLAAILVQAEHHGLLRGLAAARGGNGCRLPLGPGGLILVRADPDEGELHDVGEPSPW